MTIGKYSHTIGAERRMTIDKSGKGGKNYKQYKIPDFFLHHHTDKNHN
jgi:hypothetical protein